MGISRDLASKFAKITNDNNKQTEETMYGTVVSQGGKLYVNLDGSDTITPIVTTAEIKSGERVAVMIKGHTATVIGNITNPGASTETTGKILDEYDVIVAKIGDFELIVADKITTEQLEAELAIIDELIAKKATIDELEAVKATIKELDVEELKADIAEIDKAIINKAEITELEALHAVIDILEADLAEVETLIGGNLTMDNIQSLVLTSSKVTVDNAFIKDAMIDRVSASKLTAGSINTNLIQIGSEDGSMAINGSLQQFKDADGNVRIQIGKDSTGDFTFALYGEDGKGQLINQNGITASAIGDGLIVDDMVANDAHISGEKLDISSVITEINNNTTTIDASRIFFDDVNQSLSIAFNSLKTTVDTIKDANIEGDFANLLEKLETMTTELSVAKGQISTLVSNTTITNSNGQTISLKDDYSSVKQTVNSINTKVSSLETTTNDVKSKQVEFEQDLDGFKMTVSDSYATKDSVNTQLEDYYTKTQMNSQLTVLNDKIATKVSSTQVAEQVTGALGNYYTKSQTDSQVTQLNNSINSKVSATQVTTQLNNALTNYYTKSQTDSQITQLNNSINMKVSEDVLTESIKNIKIGGRNLLKDSDRDVTDTRYDLADYYFGDEAPVVGETYTISLKGTLGSDRTGFRAYNSGGYVYLGSLTLNSDGIYRLQTTWTVGTPSGTVADNTFLRIYQFTSTGTTASSIEWIKMEKGNKATDWTPAPEDADDDYVKLQKDINSNISSAVKDGVDSALTSVDGLYTKKGEFETFQNSVSSSFEQTSKDISMQFSNAVNASNTVNGKLEEYKAKVETYIRFDTKGMEMGKSDSPFKSVLTNQKLSFTENGYEVAYMSDNKLYITNAEILDSFIMGSWFWDVGPNGNLSLNWRG